MYKLGKTLYGLKQALRAWYNRMDNYLCNQRFRRSDTDATVYVKKSQNDSLLIMSLYVDDLLVTGGNKEEVLKIKVQMEQQF